MKLFLQILFSLFFFGILAGTVAAGMDRNIAEALRELWRDPWVRVTLYDAYFSFLTLYVWVAYKETSWISRIVWLVLILVFGTFALSSYMIIQLSRLRPGEPLERLLLRRKTA